MKNYLLLLLPVFMIGTSYGYCENWYSLYSNATQQKEIYYNQAMAIKTEMESLTYDNDNARSDSFNTTAFVNANKAIELSSQMNIAVSYLKIRSAWEAEYKK
jgi:hypothetical protein